MHITQRLRRLVPSELIISQRVPSTGTDG